MKNIRFLVWVLVALSPLCVLADAGNTLITFSTKAPCAGYAGDTYVDGSVVRDGEWYALCWSANATFGGLTSACAPVAAGDRMLLTAPLAENGHCPAVVFQIDSAVAPKSGNYFIYLLDTRGVDGKVAKAGANGLPAIVNGVAVTTAKAQGAAATAAKDAAVRKDETLTKDAQGAAAWGESAVDAATVGQPVITSFRIEGDKAVIKVSNLNASVKYNIFTGATPSAIEKTTLQVPVSSESNDATFYIDKEAGQFFKIGRQPLK